MSRAVAKKIVAETTETSTQVIGKVRFEVNWIKWYAADGDKPAAIVANGWVVSKEGEEWASYKVPTPAAGAKTMSISETIGSALKARAARVKEGRPPFNVEFDREVHLKDGKEGEKWLWFFGELEDVRIVECDPSTKKGRSRPVTRKEASDWMAKNGGAK